MMICRDRTTETPAHNERFGTMAGVARANDSAILEVSLPRKPQ